MLGVGVERIVSWLRPTLENDMRFFFHTEAEDPGCQFVGNSGEPTATISNNNDWCGDTESGFGATVAIELTRADAKRLRDTIDAWLAS